MNNSIKGLVGQTAIYGISSIIGKFLNYLLFPLYVREFNPAEYGAVTELMAYVAFLSILLTYGLETGFFRFAQNKNYSRNELLSTSISSLFISSGGFALIILFFNKPIASFIGYHNNPEYILFLGLTIAIDAFLALPFANLRLLNKAKKFAAIKLINFGLNIGLNIFFIVIYPKYFPENKFLANYFYKGLNVGYIFISFFISSFLTLLILLPDLANVLKKYRFNKLLLKRILIYSLPLMVAGFAGMLIENSDKILLKYFLVVPEGIKSGHDYIFAQIGIYGANVKIAVLMVLFIQAYRYAAEPFFFNNLNQKNSDLLYARVMKYFIIFGLIVFLGITLYIDYVKLLIPNLYREGLKVVPILLLGKLFFGIIFNLSIWYKFNNKTGYGIILTSVGAIISIGLNILLIPVIGFVGSAWAMFSAYFFVSILSFFIGRKYLKVPYDIKNILIYFGLAILIYVFNIELRKFTQWFIVYNTLFLLFFAIVIFKKEKINFNRILTK